jgi:hypothetical protein
MSQTGYVIFYRLEEPNNLQEILTRLLTYIQPDKVFAIERTTTEDNEFERSQANLDPPPSEMLLEPSNPIDIIPLYKDGTSLLVLFCNTRIDSYIVDSINKSIPENIRGNFLPTEVSIKVGYHDLYEYAENDDGHLFGRPFLSVRFFGYSTPNDWDGFREMVFKLPEVQTLKKELEQILGPLEQCVYWDV